MSIPFFGAIVRFLNPKSYPFGWWVDYPKALVYKPHLKFPLKNGGIQNSNSNKAKGLRRTNQLWVGKLSIYILSICRK